MIINTFSYLWSASAIDAIAELSEAGYDTFEVPISSPHCWPVEVSGPERAAISGRLASYGASIRSLNAGGYDVNLASPAANMRQKSVDHIKAVIDLAGAWGVREVVISPGTRRPMVSPSLELAHGWLRESLENLIPAAKQAGVRLLMENTPYCFTPTIHELQGVVRTIGDETLGIVYDAANAAYIEEDPAEALLANHESIGLVHVSDTGVDKWGHDPIGTGVIDWVRLGAAVEATCGVDNVVLEVIRDQNPLGEVQLAIGELRERGWAL